MVPGLTWCSASVGWDVRRRMIVVEPPIADARRMRKHVAEHPEDGAVLDHGGVLITADRMRLVEVDHRLHRHVAMLQQVGDLLEQHRTDALDPSHPVDHSAEHELTQMDI